MPRLAYFVSPGVAVGATGILRHISDSFAHANTYGVGPEVTYYFGRGQRRLYPYIGASAILQWGSSTFTSPLDSTMSSTASSRGQVYAAHAGIAAMLARNVAVTGEAYYEDIHNWQTLSGTTYRSTGNAYGVNFGLSVFLY